MMNIPNKILTIDLEKKILSPLTKKKQIIFNNADQTLMNYADTNKVKLLFRGDKLAMLHDRNDTGEFTALLHNIFHIGDKGKYFYQCKKSFLEDINDVSHYVFDTLFDKINAIEANSSRSNEFRDYFLGSNNKTIFLQQIKEIRDSKTKIRVRDYYLAYLHTLGDEHQSIKDCSFFVSTSLDYEVAKGYTSKENPFIIYYFIHKPYIDEAIYSSNKHFLRECTKKSNLPIYAPVYYEENEISIKGALFPQNIFGVECIVDEEKVFIANPYIFQNTDINKFPEEGIIIDQINHDSHIRSTNYNKSTTRIDHKEFYEFDATEDSKVL